MSVKMDLKNNIYVVSLTHWDREWRFPFEKTRVLLIEMMDSVLARKGMRNRRNGNIAAFCDIFYPYPNLFLLLIHFTHELISNQNNMPKYSYSVYHYTQKALCVK